MKFKHRSELIRSLIYIAGPYRGAGPAVVSEHVQAARDAMAALMAAGYGVVCPHTMTHQLEFYNGLTEEMYLAQGLEQLRRCDAMIVLPGWSDSEGTQAEIWHATEWHIPFVYIEERPWQQVYELLNIALSLDERPATWYNDGTS